MWNQEHNFKTSGNHTVGGECDQNDGEHLVLTDKGEAQLERDLASNLPLQQVLNTTSVRQTVNHYITQLVPNYDDNTLTLKLYETQDDEPIEFIYSGDEVTFF